MKETVIFYGTPGYGHINCSLYLVEMLTGAGYRVVYYAMDNYKKVVEETGAEYRSYKLDMNSINLNDVGRLLRFQKILLELTYQMLGNLLEEAVSLNPICVIHDSVALWGRAVAQIAKIPAICFYTILALDRVGSKFFFEYSLGFLKDLAADLKEIPQAIKYKNKFKKEFNFKKLNMIDVFMNKESLNVMAYSRQLQPNGKKFDQSYFFIGPITIYRKPDIEDDFIYPERPMIYLSLGTIFNKNNKFLNSIFSQFGGKKYRVLFAAGRELSDEESTKIPENFIVKRYVNQKNALKQAALFITAGGMNSIHDAVSCGVPCLLCPQQGEQRVNSKRFVKLGFGEIMRKPDRLYEQANRMIEAPFMWSVKKEKKIITIHESEFWNRWNCYLKQT